MNSSLYRSVAAAVAAIAGTWAVRRASLRWGTNARELEMPLPGDDCLRAPDLQATRAITINAPRLHVWPLMSILQAARDEGAELRLIQPSEPVHEDVIGLVRRAEAIAAEDPAARAEEAAWTTTDPGRDDGIPQDLLGPGASDDRAPVRRFHASTGSAQFEHRTTLAVLSTPGDSAQDWVAAGQALQRVLLVATTYFVHASFATTVLENPTTRHDLRGVLSLDGAPQMLMRLGYSSMPKHTPRRSVPRVQTLDLG